MSTEGKDFILHLLIFETCIDQSDLSFLLCNDALMEGRNFCYTDKSRHLNIHPLKNVVNFGNDCTDLFSILFDF